MGMFFIGLIVVAAILYLRHVQLSNRVPKVRKIPAWMPQDLRGASVVMVEEMLKASTSEEYGLIGRLDRVYQLETGECIPVEFKTRKQAKAWESDVAQLSLQAWLLRQAGHDTSSHAYVVAELPNGVRQAIRVDLRDDAYCEKLILRYHQIMADRVAPKAKPSPAKCQSCGHRANCQAAA